MRNRERSNESIDKYTFKAGINHQVSKFGLGSKFNFIKTDEQLGSQPYAEAFRQNPFTTLGN
jgi:hypothetical protein